MDSYADYANKTLAVKWVAAGNQTHVPDSCCIENKLKCGENQGTKADKSVIHTKVSLFVIALRIT